MRSTFRLNGIVANTHVIPGETRRERSFTAVEDDRERGPQIKGQLTLDALLRVTRCCSWRAVRLRFELVALAGVEGVAEPIAQEVEGEHSDHDSNPGGYSDMRSVPEQRATGREHSTP